MCIDCCRASKLFKACDQDDSGTIDLEEFGALLKEVDDTGRFKFVSTIGGTANTMSFLSFASIVMKLRI